MTQLDFKKDPARRCLRLAAWPVADQEAWAAALAKGDLFEPGGRGADWAPSTRMKVEKAYGRWMTWLSVTGRMEPNLAPADRVTPENVRAYVADLAVVTAPYSVLGRVRDLRHAIRAMAPARDWRWMCNAANRLRSRVRSVRNKEQLMVGSSDLVRFGIELMLEADHLNDLSPFVRAVKFRDGLMIAMLAARPVRRANFAAIEIGRHLLRQGDHHALRFAPEETKTGAAYQAPLPEPFTGYIDRYLEYYRPWLVSHAPRPSRTKQRNLPGNAFWISTQCSAMSEQALYYRVTTLTKARFGRSLSPHLFRDASATSIATDDPGHVYITKAVLGHASLATSEQHYNHAQALEASRRHQALIMSLREESDRAEAPESPECT